MRSRKLLALIFTLLAIAPALAGYMTLLGAGVGSIQPAVSWVSTTDPTFPNSSLIYSGPSLSTMFDSTGKLTYKPNNLLTQSNTFSNAAWTKTSLSVSNANAVDDPFGGTNATTITATGANGEIYQSFASAFVGATALPSIWVRRRTGSGLIRMYAATGTPSTVTVTGSWTQIYVNTTNVASGTVYFGLRVATSGDAIDIYAGVLPIITYETTPRTADQVITTSAAYYGPRIDYDPNTLAVNGLLIEEARTNYLVAGNGLTNAAWTGGTRAAGVATGIDGLTSMNRATMAAGSTQVYQTVTQAAGNYAGAAYFKAETGATWIYLQLSDGPGNGYRVWFNLSTGAIGSNTTIGTGQSGLTSSVTPVGNGVYRFNVNGNIPNSTKQLLFAAVRADGSTSTTANDTVLFNYGTLEPGTFPTSPIATAAASVTRAADVVQFTGTALTALQGSAGSAIIQSISLNGSSPTAITNLIRGTNSILYRDTTGKTGTTNGTTALLTATAPTWNAALRNGLAWSGTGRSLVFTGGAVATDANAVSNGGTLYLGSNNGSAVENGWYQSFAIYNQRLPDATLQAKSVVGASYAANDNVNPFAPQFAANDNLPVHWRIAL